MLRLLITGGGGQLGRELKAQAKPRFDVSAPGSREFDISNAKQVQQLFKNWRPDVVINAAAYTAVDQAESDEKAAESANVEGPKLLAQQCAECDAKLIHVSTDFVFDGSQCSPYTPASVPNPINAYGWSKYRGEQAVLNATEASVLIVRTAWLYGPTGRNFCSTMLRLLSERDVVPVVCDQIGTPTSTRTLASVLLQLAEKKPNQQRILHCTNAGVASWYDFATAIRELACEIWPEECWGQVIPIYSKDFPTPARRPRYSVLNTEKTYSMLGQLPQHWRAELKAVLKMRRMAQPGKSTGRLPPSGSTSERKA